MPIEYGDKQVVVSCAGDIEVLSFPCCGEHTAAWLTLGEGESGEPGREVKDLGPRNLQDHEGVLIGVVDVRSVDALIDQLQRIREHVERRANAEVSEEASGD